MSSPTAATEKSAKKPMHVVIDPSQAEGHDRGDHPKPTLQSSATTRLSNVHVEVKAPPTRGQKTKKACKRQIRRWCRVVCNSKCFAAITTILTIYALFGDDMRLIFTFKKDDGIFDIVTITAMTMFTIEIIAFIGGKPDYLFGFFFWLDILSTVTLVVDITHIGEEMFGDSISKATPNDTGGGQGGAGDSAEAARAARMSRAGTKAGRVVRLIRLLRLLKMIKFFKKEDKHDMEKFYPGDDFDEDEDSNIQESAVSKKLSEMTTRRVIILVLTIMLSLPVFRPELYQEQMDTSGQYGINYLYRRWRKGMYEYDPSRNASNAQRYMASTERRVYEDLFLMYIFKHNWHVQNVPGTTASPKDSFNRLFWIGTTPSKAPLAQYVFPTVESYDWNKKWSGSGSGSGSGSEWAYYSGEIPAKVQESLRSSWNTSYLCVLDIYRGRSLIEYDSPKVMCPDELRYQERTVIYPQLLSKDEAVEITFMFVFDRRDGSKFEALLNTCQTVFVCLLLGIGSMVFANDANKLVLSPIERMISKLDRIRNNPLEALKIGDEEHHREQVKAAKMSDDDPSGSRIRLCIRKCCSRLCPCCQRNKKPDEHEPMETQVLETTIIKIGSLLALGFGEAGAEIIGQNMKDNDSSAVMGMIPGRTVEGVFAFCDIQNFTDATEVLQDQVMIFVNRIAAIVHSFCDEFWGNPNKNVGDAFLLVWRLSGQPLSQQRRLTDMALLSLATIVAKIAASAEIAEYRSHVKLLKRVPNYRTKLGFGIHLGWAIEGAIGSEFKIDASYLSPNVNMAARLESETRYYGCEILLSAAVRNFLTDAIADECRLVDHVDFEGDNHMKVYSLDLDQYSLEVDDPEDVSLLSKAAKFKIRWLRKQRKEERWEEDYNLHGIFENDPHMMVMRRRYTEEFFCRFQMAFLNYEAGNWPIAKVMLENTRFLMGVEDGASTALLRLLQVYGNVAPPSWRGYREFGVSAKGKLIADMTLETDYDLMQSLGLIEGLGNNSGPTMGSRHNEDEERRFLAEQAFQAKEKKRRELELAPHSITVKIVSATGLRNADWMGKSDPYCVCEVPGKANFKTKVIQDSVTPSWNHEEAVPDFDPSRDELQFTIFDSDLDGDDLLGRVTLDSKTFWPQGFSGKLLLEDHGGTGDAPFLNVVVTVDQLEEDYDMLQ